MQFPDEHVILFFMPREFQAKTVLKQRYEIRSMIGKGGMCTTYLAHDTAADGTEVVVKALSLSSLDDWKIFDLFKREAAVLKRMDHPHIPDYIDYFEDTLDGESYFLLVQEYARGRNLFELKQEGKNFTLPELRRILQTLLDVLDYIHNLTPPLIHRDVNPKNIIMDNTGKVYLVDFGAVGFMVKNTLAAAQSGTFVGTIGYIAPEQLYGKALPASDIYSLGITMVFLITGKKPSEFPMDGLRLDVASALTKAKELAPLLETMVRPDLKKRFKSAKEIITALEHPQAPRKEASLLSEMFTEMHTAIRRDDRETAAELIKQGIPLNPRDSGYKPFLLTALECANPGMTELLLKNGADVNRKYRGLAPLHRAILDNNPDLVKLLLSFGADPDMRDDKYGKRPLQHARKQGSPRILRMLYHAGARDEKRRENAGRAAGPADLPAPPRDIPFLLRFLIWKKRCGASVHLGTGFVFMGLIFVYVFVLGARLVPSLWLLRADSTAQGYVTSIKKTSSSVNDVTVYRNNFSFTASDGKKYAQHSFTTGKVLTEGNLVSVRYVGSHPRYAVIEGARFSEFGFMTLFTLILPLIGYGMLIKGRARQVHKTMLLLKRGTATGGRIAYKRRTATRYRFYYTYDTPRFGQREGYYITKDEGFAKAGQSVPVLYLSRAREYSQLAADPLPYHDGGWDLQLGRKFYLTLGYWAAQKVALALPFLFVYYLVSVFVL